MTDIVKDAAINPCKLYRYRLTRVWDPAKKLVCFVMLNPSTADAATDDPTIRRCIAFAMKWGYGGIVVVNLAAYRATDPDVLRDIEDPIGADNAEHVMKAISEAGLVVAAWGDIGKYMLPFAKIVSYAPAAKITVMCLGRTKGGQPRHPLYVRADKELEIWAE